ncbi:Os03g0648450 [Oryza sativa Japonica Group]|uniref:Os03g0648450 protein n=1 Tax=Oryza sativa subsp. japonica TaxID=39947 RepID=A0A0P0W0R5_ORYSJ|nr:hypothetical protein EE612_019269 [Oryza sativa]BAS85494.1 Os03g0648450 [Oryza sativa Japonica Group]
MTSFLDDILCLLLRALNSLGTSRHLIVLIIRLLSSLGFPAHLFLNVVDIVHRGLLAFIYLHFCQLGCRLRWKHSLESLALFRRQGIRELHREMNVELPLHERPLVHWHSLIVYCLELA